MDLATVQNKIHRLLKAYGIDEPQNMNLLCQKLQQIWEHKQNESELLALLICAMKKVLRRIPGVRVSGGRNQSVKKERRKKT